MRQTVKVLIDTTLKLHAKTFIFLILNCSVYITVNNMIHRGIHINIRG